jgi:hypothetical protein
MPPANQCIHEIETGDLRPAESSRWAFQFVARPARRLFFSLIRPVLALVIAKRPLRRGVESKRESAAVGEELVVLL